jgi:hypothetical protein
LSVDHLARHRGIGELGRIGPHQQRQRPVALLVVAGGEIERAAELDAVGALVGDELLSDARQLRGGIGEVE